MAVTMSTLSAILKEVYESPLREQLNNDVATLRRIERSSDGVETNNLGGKYVTFPIHYGRNGGIGARREMEDLPKAGRQATAAARIGLKYQYGSIALSGQALALAESNTQAFLSALELETDGLKTDLAKNLNQQVYRTGSGQLATTSTTAASQTLTITSGINNLSVGTVFDIYSATNLANDSTPVSSGHVIDGIDKGAGTVHVSASVTPGSNAVLVRAGSANREWTGLAAIVNDDGVLYNIDPDDVDQWRSVVDDNSGSNRALTEGRIIANVDAVRENGGKTSVIMTTLGVRRSYFALLVQQRQFINTSRENKTFEGGFSGLAFTTDQGEIPITTDVDAPKNTMWGLSEKNIKVYRDADWAFMDRDGNMWTQIPGDTAGTWKDGYSATMFQYSELGSDRRNVHFLIKDLTEATA